MTRSKCGLIVLLAAGGLAACGGDPTESFQDTNPTIIADPTSVFLDEGTSKFVVAELRDEQGNQLVASFQPTNVGSNITVELDTAFLETTNGTKLPTRERFIVTGLTPGSTSFTLASGSTTLDVPVRVTPTSVPVTFSNATPGPDEPVTITLPSGYTFNSAAAVESNLGPAIIQSISEDGTSLTALIIPGSLGPLTLTGFDASFLPGVPLTLDSSDPITAAAFPGIGDITTAPTIAVPGAVGDSTFLLGGGGWTGVDITGDGGVGAQYYTFTVTTGGDYHFVTNWPNDADLDAIVCFDVDCSDGAFAGTGLTQPEDGVLTLDPGTYYLAIVLFAGTGPDFYTVDVKLEPPAP